MLAPAEDATIFLQLKFFEAVKQCPHKTGDGRWLIDVSLHALARLAAAMVAEAPDYNAARDLFSSLFEHALLAEG
jgi:hypothetical protein